MRQFSLLVWAYHCILMLARAIADLAGCEQIQTVHLAEALQYRPKLMMGQRYFDRRFALRMQILLGMVLLK